MKSASRYCEIFKSQLAEITEVITSVHVGSTDISHPAYLEFTGVIDDQLKVHKNFDVDRVHRCFKKTL